VPTQNTLAMLSNCRSCNSGTLTLAAIRKNFPLYIWPLPKSESTKLEDIQLYVCDECGYMQLQNIDKKKISDIYRNEAFNIDNLNQNKGRFKLISNNDLNKFSDKKVLEIGGGRNSFVKVLPKKTEKWVADFSIEKSVKSILNGSYTGDFINLEVKEKEFDFIFMFHVLEHFNNPGKVLNKIKTLLKKTGRVIIEVPNFEFESQKRSYYTLFHMHISLFTDLALTSMMTRYGFNCVGYYKKNDVLLAEFSIGDKKKTGNHKQHSMDLIGSLQLNLETTYVKLKKIFINLEDKKVAIFGAGGATTLFLYNFPFLIEKLSCVIDNNESKWGRFICDRKIPVISYNEFLNKNIKNVIILEESHIQYIKNKQINFINIGNLNNE